MAPEPHATDRSWLASGDRHNDIFNRMRGITAKLQKDEIEKLAEYYSAVRLFRAQD